MAKIRVGINGFGRIGRNFFRATLERGGDFELVAANDIGDTKTMAHLLKHDSVLGTLDLPVEAGDGFIRAGDHEIKFTTERDLIEAIEEGAVLRVRPKAMTVAVIIAGLLPIMLGGGTGSEVMRRIAAPMVGGMITAPLLSMLVLPVAYLLLHRRNLVGSSARGSAVGAGVAGVPV